MGLFAFSDAIAAVLWLSTGWLIVSCVRLKLGVEKPKDFVRVRKIRGFVCPHLWPTKTGEIPCLMRLSRKGTWQRYLFRGLSNQAPQILDHT